MVINPESELLMNLKNLTAHAMHGTYDRPTGGVDEDVLRSKVVQLFRGVSFPPVEGKEVLLAVTSRATETSPEATADAETAPATTLEPARGRRARRNLEEGA